MNNQLHLSQPWQQWILENLARGRSHASMVESMVRDNFEPGFALASIQRLANTSTRANRPLCL